jgi:hypothetical protein
MTITAGVGMSHHHNHNVAGREAAEQALEKAGVARPDLVFMFASIGYDQHSLVRAVREATGGAPLTGCSAEGTINRDDADESNFSVVTAISSDELEWTNGIASGLSADPHAVGTRVPRELLPHISPSAIGLFVFPEGLTRNVIYEIDGKPAIEVLKEYLPEGALVEDRDWMRYAISLALTTKAPSYMKDEEYVVRGVPGVRLADGSIIVQSEIPEGTSIWFSSRDKEKITTGFDRMAQQITEQLGDDKPKLVFQFECMTRGKTMLREQEKLQLLRRFRQSVGPEAPWAGFYTIGEIGPVEEHNDRHLFTSVVLALS